MSLVVLFNKPYGVLCQFSPQAGRHTLKDFLPQSEIYAAGRLDADSEGLVVLTADGTLQHRITDPAHKLPKTYLVQVEGVPTESALEQLRSGVALKLTLRAQRWRARSTSPGGCGYVRRPCVSAVLFRPAGSRSP